MTAEQPVTGIELEPIRWSYEHKAGRDQVLPCDVLKKMPALENVLQAHRKFRIA